MLLDNKVALVTGAGRGIGRGIALGFAREGAKVAVSARTEESFQSIKREINALGGTVLTITADSFPTRHAYAGASTHIRASWAVSTSW